MGFVDKINHLMNPDTIDGYDDNDYIFDGDDAGYGDGYQQGYSNGSAQQGAPQGFQPNALELKVVKPEKFEDASAIADHLLDKRTVVLNLEETNSEVARRLIDFLSGVAYSIDGNLKKVADHTFVITPNNVVLSADKAAKKQQTKQDTFGDF